MTLRRILISFLAIGLMMPAAGRAEPMHIFIFFFGPQSAAMEEGAKPIVQAAAKAWLGGPPSARILIIGHCDTSEADPKALSLARAEAIQAELIRDGVPASAGFVLKAAAAGDLLVPTGPNVPQAQNRRGYIDISF